MGAIIAGTSGFDYSDWVGADRFYPPSLERRRADWLTYYASQFPVVELNFTYYGETSPQQLERMLRRVDPQRPLYLLEGVYTPQPGFEFVIKAYASLTHRISELWRTEAKRFRGHIAPLVDSGRLLGVLAQFPSRFHAADELVRYIEGLAGELAPVPLIVEPRHHSWFTPQWRARLAQLPVVVCGIDAPREARLPSFAQEETLAGGAGPFAYVRLHGRREGYWWTGDAASRYEYSYSRQELVRVAGRLLELDSPKTYVLFNNHRHAGAASNARLLTEILDELAAQFGGGETAS